MRAAVQAGSGEVIITGGQTVNLSFASSGINWTASSDQPFVTVAPASGTGNGGFTVNHVAPQTPPANRTGRVGRPEVVQPGLPYRLTRGCWANLHQLQARHQVRPQRAASLGCMATRR
jgi:hypothetical protein